VLLPNEGNRRGFRQQQQDGSTVETVNDDASLFERARAFRSLPSALIQKAILAEAGVTEAAVAEHLGCHRVTVHRWVQGHRRPTGDLLTKYAELLSKLQAIRHG
jgi:DNA-binding transcriptional regulator YiaG